MPSSLFTDEELEAFRAYDQGDTERWLNYGSRAGRFSGYERLESGFAPLDAVMNLGPVQSSLEAVGLAGTRLQATGSRLTGGMFGDADDLHRQAGEMAAAADYRDPSWLSRTYRGAGSSILQTAPFAIAGGAAGPVGGILAPALAAGTMEFSESITEARDAGLEGADVYQYAGRAGAAEALITGLFSAAGKGGIEAALASKEIVRGGFREVSKAFGKGFVNELEEETLIWVLQNVNRRASEVNPAEWEGPDGSVLSSPAVDQLSDVFSQTLMMSGMVNAKPLTSEGWKAAREAVRQNPETFAEVWSRANPEKADRLAGLEKPNREEWDEVGPPVRMNQQERQDFAEQVRRLRPQPEPVTGEASQPEGAIGPDLSTTTEDPVTPLEPQQPVEATPQPSQTDPEPQATPQEPEPAPKLARLPKRRWFPEKYGWRSPVIPGREELVGIQSSGLPEGQFFALDRPFDSSAHDAAKARKVEIPELHSVFDPEGLISPHGKREHAPQWQAIVAEASKSANIRRGLTDALKRRGFDAMVRGIDGDPNNRELIVFPEKVEQPKPAESTPQPSGLPTITPGSPRAAIFQQIKDLPVEALQEFAFARLGIKKRGKKPAREQLLGEILESFGDRVPQGIPIRPFETPQTPPQPQPGREPMPFTRGPSTPGGFGDQTVIAPAPEDPGPTESTADRLLAAMQQAEPDVRRGGAAYIPDVRKASGLDPAEFDAMLREGVRSGRLAIHKHGSPFTVKPEVREQFYRSGEDEFHVVSLRGDFALTGTPEPAAPKPIENVRTQQPTMLPGAREVESLPGQQEMFDDRDAIGPPPEAPKKKRPKLQKHQREAVEEVAREWNATPDDILQAVEEHAKFNQGMDAEFAAIREFRRKNPEIVFAAQKDRDVASLKHFDLKHRSFLEENPGMEGLYPTPEDLWEAIKAGVGKVDKAAKYSPEKLREAAAFFMGRAVPKDADVSFDVAELEQQTSEKPKKDWLDERYDQAKKNIGKIARGETPFTSGVPIDDLVVIGLYHFRKGARAFSKWASAMVQELGERVKPHLAAVWQAMHTKHPELAKIGRPELANPATAPEARLLVDETDEARKQAGQPQRRKDAEVKAEADERLKNRAKEKERLLKTAREGGQLGDTDTAVAKEIVNAEALDAVLSGDIQRMADAQALIDAYRRTGTEQGRAMRQRRDPVETPAQRRERMLAEAILTPPAKPQFDKEKGGDPSKWLREIERLKALLKSQGIDLRDLRKLAGNPVKTARVLGHVQTAKADAWDAAYEYWRNAILSAPTTQQANVYGNLSLAAWHYTAERLTEAMLNTAIRRPEGAQLGEAKYLLAGFLPGLSKAARNFLMTWRSEIPTFDADVTKLDHPPNIAIKGAKGRVIRAPQRLLLAIDDFSKTLVAEMEVGAQAYRMAKKEGLKDQAMQARIAQLMDDGESEAWNSARDKARELTFQKLESAPGKFVARHLLNMRKELPALGFIVPFIMTPTAIFEQGLRRTPLGTATLGWKVYKAAQTGDWSGVTSRAAEQVLAWALVLALMSNDPEDPWITGSVADYDLRDREEARRTFQTQSIKIGGEWYSYSRIEPFATTIAVMVDSINAIRSPSTENKIAVPFKSLIGQLKSKTFLSGVGDMVQIFQGPNHLEAVGKWASDFGVSWIPNIVRSAGRSGDDHFPERAVWGDGTDWWKMLAKRTIQKTELGIVDDVPAYDVWGRPAERGDSPVPRTDWLWRFLMPIYTKTEDVFIGDRVLLNWNLSVENPADEYKPIAPPKSFVIRGKRVYLTDEQYADFVRDSGELAQRLIERRASGLNPEQPTERDVEIVKRSLETARERIRRRMIVEMRDD